MARINDADVFAVVSDDVEGVLTDLSVFITTASSYMTAIESAYPAFAAIGEDLLKVVETYLAAHYAVIKTKFVKTEKADVVGQGFEVKSDLGLDATWYGGQAKSFDISGTLGTIDEDAKSGRKRSVSFGYVGKDHTDGISE